MSSLSTVARGGSSFVGLEANTILGALFKGKNYKITNARLGTKVNIYLE
jgi:hypothetical protein